MTTSPNLRLVAKATCTLCMALLASVVFSGRVAAEGWGRWWAPKPRPLTPVERPWLFEAELDGDPSLHATAGQTVVLHLEESERFHPRFRRNMVRFRIDKAGDYAFCIPDDDPYVAMSWLRRTRGRVLRFHVRGAACSPVHLSPGRYELHIFHDGRAVPEGGQQAFVHAPEARGVSPDDLPVTPAFDFMALRGANDRFVTDQTGSLPQLGSVATKVSSSEVWRVAPLVRGKFTIQNKTGKPNLCRDEGGQIFQGSGQGTCPEGPDWVGPAKFRMYSVGTWKFHFSTTYGDNETYIGGPIDFDQDQMLIWTQAGTHGIFTIDYQGYDCTTPCTDDTTLALNSGEIALFTQCNFQGPAFIFAADKADLSIYDPASTEGLSLGNNTARSLRMGPDTVAVLHSEAQSGGVALTAGTDIPCLDDTALGNDALSSFEIVDQSALAYIVSSQGCRGCVLTGIDLSNQPLSGYDFTGSVFTGANLSGADIANSDVTNAVFSGASTNLQGTKFDGATLACTDFLGADVAVASFSDVTITDDFSCQLNLEGTSIDFGTFDVTDWRYLDLTGSKMSNVPDVLSTLAAPLDLSGATLSNVRWLPGVALDGANLGCFASDASGSVCPAAAGTPHCTTLDSIDLTRSSLQGACLKDASLHGALLSEANLSGADLSGAKLLGLPDGSPATLSRAFMADVKLIGADLTGVIADNVSFYSAADSADASQAIMTGATFNGSFMLGANFDKALLEGTGWQQAVLVGVNFGSAKLEKNAATNQPTDFTGAYLQGANFQNATVLAASFDTSYWDLTGTATLVIQVPEANLNFAGFWRPHTAECVLAQYDVPSVPPITNSANVCPDLSLGPCNAVWEMPRIPIAQAQPPSAISPALPVNVQNQCTAVDLDWGTAGP